MMRVGLVWDLIACDAIVERGAKELHRNDGDELFPDLK